MPIRHSSPMVQPCRMTPWPTVTRAPMTSGAPSGLRALGRLTCRTAPSWMLLPAPMRMKWTSPRIVTWGHTEASSPSTTSPITVALGWM